MSSEDGWWDAEPVRGGNGTAKSVMNGLQSVIGGRVGSI
jgi:hypothetical protein